MFFLLNTLIYGSYFLLLKQEVSTPQTSTSEARLLWGSVLPAGAADFLTKHHFFPFSFSCCFPQAVQAAASLQLFISTPAQLKLSKTQNFPRTVNDFLNQDSKPRFPEMQSIYFVLQCFNRQISIIPRQYDWHPKAHSTEAPRNINAFSFLFWGLTDHQLNCTPLTDKWSQHPENPSKGSVPLAWISTDHKPGVTTIYSNWEIANVGS